MALSDYCNHSVSLGDRNIQSGRIMLFYGGVFSEFCKNWRVARFCDDLLLLVRVTVVRSCNIAIPTPS